MEGNMSISVSELASYLLERAVYILISGAEPVLLHKYQLRRLVLLCGTKLHKVELVVNDIFQQVCRLYFDGAGDEKGVGLKCYECPKNAERFFEVEVSRFARGECSNEAEPLREIDLRRDVLLEQYSRALRQQENPNDPPSPSGPPVAVKYVFWVNYKSIFNKIISASLTRFLAGAFITVQPTLRWQSALAVLQPSFATHGHPDTRQGGSIPCVVFIGGASGSGKSTLSSTLSLRLGITHVLSTDNVRELVRWESTHSQTGEVPPPELFVSTYEAFRADPSNQNPTEEEVVEAYKRQCGCILKKLRDIIFCIVVQQRKSIIVEGVHLLPDFISELSSEIRRGENNNVAVISTLVYIKDEEKHKERFFCALEEYEPPSLQQQVRRLFPIHSNDSNLLGKTGGSAECGAPQGDILHTVVQKHQR
ncbi:hypothetical protein AGDE_13858 [Angomonas deanei]|uniref:AAA domain containing protein n=1 Tax=Angomonas deanei TaxID=59799 RepID=A0A7G2CHC0_9TRYP|nr:hypothetical protein AGDE_13858 [Angomonas deanei]CAD2219268.1 hypothetical protein, conserved [Angomonas deanei]|eukprot:EPY21685.1 hypothetical protein AGDE_13858 [Angomonas deanei]